MKTIKLFLICFALFLPLLALGANGDAVATPAADFGKVQLYIMLATPFLAPLMTALAKKIVPRIPKDYLPALTVFLGTLGNSLATMTVGDGVSWQSIAGGAFASLGGIGIRELKDRIKPEVATTPTPTK